MIKANNCNTVRNFISTFNFIMYVAFKQYDKRMAGTSQTLNNKGSVLHYTAASYYI
jgi:hypothetical protein